MCAPVLSLRYANFVMVCGMQDEVQCHALTDDFTYKIQTCDSPNGIFAISTSNKFCVATLAKT